MSRKERKRRLAVRERDAALARKDYRAAQEAYERARAVDLPAAEKLRLLRDRARAKLGRKQKWVAVAERKLKDSVPLDPELTRISVNHSSRGGVKPRLIVLHITVSHNRPGLSDIDGILSFFDNPSAQASSHIVNDRDGNDARCVRDVDKAWTQAAFNPPALSIEQIELEVKSRARWMRESLPQLENTAAWVAHWSHLYDIPLRVSTSSGVCQHRDLGAAGGGHIDCAPDFPIDYVIERAVQIREARYGH